MSEPSKTGPMSGTRARIRRTNEPEIGQPARLLGLEDRPGPSLHPRHELDGGEDHERQAMADAAGDERLEQVVGEGREQEQDRREERDEDPARRDESERQPLTGDRQRARTRRADRWRRGRRAS